MIWRKYIFRKVLQCSKSQRTKHMSPEMCSCGSDPFCRIACVIFHELTVVSYPEVFQLILQIWWMFDWTCFCERLFCTHETKKYLRDTSMNRYQFVTSNESSKNTNDKFDNNKLSTNKRIWTVINRLIMRVLLMVRYFPVVLIISVLQLYLWLNVLLVFLVGLGCWLFQW